MKHIIFLYRLIKQKLRFIFSTEARITTPTLKCGMSELCKRIGYVVPYEKIVCVNKGIDRGRKYVLGVKIPYFRAMDLVNFLVPEFIPVMERCASAKISSDGLEFPCVLMLIIKIEKDKLECSIFACFSKTQKTELFEYVNCRYKTKDEIPNLIFSGTNLQRE